MILGRLEDFRDILPAHRAVAGLDLGTATIGVAVSDLFRQVASPLETIRRKNFGADAAHLLGILSARDIGGLVLGLIGSGLRRLRRNIAPGAGTKGA